MSGRGRRRLWASFPRVKQADGRGGGTLALPLKTVGRSKGSQGGGIITLSEVTATATAGPAGFLVFIVYQKMQSKTVAGRKQGGSVMVK